MGMNLKGKSLAEITMSELLEVIAEEQAQIAAHPPPVQYPWTTMGYRAKPNPDGTHSFVYFAEQHYPDGRVVDVTPRPAHPADATKSD
jgi:hypothetical protein